MSKTDDTIESLRAQFAEVERERDAALAACVEIRASLERMIKYAVEDRATTPGSTRLERQITRANCLLTRTDLGRGMVAVPREVVERMCGRLRRSTVGGASGLLTDLGALLDGGKGRG